VFAAGLLQAGLVDRDGVRQGGRVRSGRRRTPSVRRSERDRGRPRSERWWGGRDCRDRGRDHERDHGRGRRDLANDRGSGDRARESRA
jgi:hypothetical protein